MADSKISNLDSITSLTDDDLLVVVNDPGGTPTTNKITVANALGGKADLSGANFTGAVALTNGSTITDGQSATREVGYRNIPTAGIKTSSYTFTADDVGHYILIGAGGSIVVPDGTTPGIYSGDVFSVINNTASTITINVEAMNTAYIAGDTTDYGGGSITLAARGVATILYTSNDSCVVTGNVS